MFLRFMRSKMELDFADGNFVFIELKISSELHHHCYQTEIIFRFGYLPNMTSANGTAINLTE